MKETELMIGDWVDFYHPYEPENKIVTRHCVTEIFECGHVGITNHPNPVHKDHIEPVKITSEILEKNGFVANKHVYPYPYYEYEIKEIKVKVGFAFPQGNRSSYKKPWVCIDTECVYIEHLPCIFVHELQHVLRLCKIKKEIVL